MATTFLDRAKMAVSGTPGTGAITLGAAVAGFRTFAAAGALDGAIISYVIEDGGAWEVGHGTYAAASNTLARTTIIASSANGQPITASTSAVVYATLLAEDLAGLGSSGGSSGSGVVPDCVSAMLMIPYGLGYFAFSVASLEFLDSSGNVIAIPSGSMFDALSEGNPASSAFDGDPTTFWSTAGNANPPNASWLRVQFGSTMSGIAGVRVTARQGSDNTNASQTSENMSIVFATAAHPTGHVGYALGGPKYTAGEARTFMFF